MMTSSEQEHQNVTGISDRRRSTNNGHHSGGGSGEASTLNRLQPNEQAVATSATAEPSAFNDGCRDDDDADDNDADDNDADDDDADDVDGDGVAKHYNADKTTTYFGVNATEKEFIPHHQGSSQGYSAQNQPQGRGQGQHSQAASETKDHCVRMSAAGQVSARNFSQGRETKQRSSYGQCEKSPESVIDDYIITDSDGMIVPISMQSVPNSVQNSTKPGATSTSMASANTSSVQPQTTPLCLKKNVTAPSVGTTDTPRDNQRVSSSAAAHSDVSATSSGNRRAAAGGGAGRSSSSSSVVTSPRRKRKASVSPEKLDVIATSPSRQQQQHKQLGSTPHQQKRLRRQ